MPRIPKFIGDFMDAAFSGFAYKMTVIKTELLSPAVKIITLSGDLSKAKFQTGQAVLIRVDDTNYRNYTPSYWSSASGICELIVHLHGNAPGSNYMAALNPNDELSISFPRGLNMYKTDHTHHFFFGDESTIGVYKSLHNRIAADGHKCTGILELDEPSLHLPGQLGLQVDVVGKSAGTAAAAIALLHAMGEAAWAQYASGYFYLMGNARSIQNFRRALKDRGVPYSRITTTPFWAEGKVGL